MIIRTLHRLSTLSFLVLALATANPLYVDIDILPATHADLAVGVPYEDIMPISEAGAVNLFFNHFPGGISTQDDWRLHQDDFNVEEWTNPSDRFGYALASGDFNGDGRGDLAVGVPGEDIDGVDCGAVQVFYGLWPFGFSTDNDEVLYQGYQGMQESCESGDKFGAALSAGDYNADGYSDLAIGVIGEGLTFGAIELGNAGVVQILSGSSNGLTTVDDQLFRQSFDQINVDGYFGFSLASGDFNRDGRDDLAIGKPYDSKPTPNMGRVWVLYSDENGLTMAGYQDWFQSHASIPGSSGPGDLFGYSLCVGDFNGDDFDDLGIGVPGESTFYIQDYGGVISLYGSQSGLDSIGSQLFTYKPLTYKDSFGTSLAAGDFDGDGYDDLASGVPGEEVLLFVWTINDAGAVRVLYGSSGGLTDLGRQTWTQAEPGVPDDPESMDHLGSSLAAGDFNWDGYEDLAIGVPMEDVDEISDAGLVLVLFGREGGLSEEGALSWHQDLDDVDGQAGEGDKFGYSLAAVTNHYRFIYLPIITGSKK